MKNSKILFQITASISFSLLLSLQSVSATKPVVPSESAKVSNVSDGNEIVINTSMIDKFNNYNDEVVNLKDVIFNKDFEQAKIYLSAYNSIELPNTSDKMIMQTLNEKVEKINSYLETESKLKSRALLTQK